MKMIQPYYERKSPVFELIHGLLSIKKIYPKKKRSLKGCGKP